MYDTTEHAYRIHPDGSGHVTLHGHGEDGDWSPDGTHIASLEGRCSPTNAGYEWICIESADGTSAHQLTHGNDVDWSPDGRELVVDRASVKTENSDLYIINADGSGLRPLVRGAASTWDPSWQPNAKDP